MPAGPGVTKFVRQNRIYFEAYGKNLLIIFFPTLLKLVFCLIGKITN